MTTKRKMTPEEWQTVRERWEADPRDGQNWIIREMNLPVSHVAVIKRMRKEGWAKKASLKTIVERAQAKADEKASGVTGKVTNHHGAVTDTTAVDLRADIIDRHRREWQEHRERFPLEAIVVLGDGPETAAVSAGGEKLARTAKTVAEMIRLRQQGEREAWGLDAVANDTGVGMATLDELDQLFAVAVEKADRMLTDLQRERGRLAPVDADAVAG
jgi:hypothetical protein